MSSYRILFLSVVLVLLLSVCNTKACAKGEHEGAHHQEYHYSRQAAHHDVAQERSIDPLFSSSDGVAIDRRYNHVDDFEEDGSVKSELGKQYDPDPDPEDYEEEEIDVEEAAEGEIEEEDQVKTAPARYDGAQLWRIHTNNVSNEDVIQLFENQYDGCVWKAKKDYVDVFVERSRQNEARTALRNFELPYEIAINDVQNLIDRQDRSPYRTKGKSIVKRQAAAKQMTWDAYYDLIDIYGYMRILAQKYPTICKLVNIGKSVEGRGLLVMKVAGPKSGRSIWVDGGIHAREWISPAAVMYIMDQFVRYWSKQPAHIRSATWYFLPVMNPDGYQYSRSTDRLWRKNRRNFGSCHGVDLNRNFDFKWTGVGASNNPCDMTYRGPKGLSEPESRAVAQFLENMPQKPAAYITFHSYGQYILYPWGFASAIPSDHRELKKIGLDAAESAKLIDGALYTVAPAFQPFGAAAGGSDDWAKGHLKVKKVFTIESRDTGRFGFLLPTDQIRVTCREALTITGVISKASVN